MADKKDTYYFTHDYNARNDPKLIKLLISEGMAGLGLFWCLVEMLYEQKGKLFLSELDTYAFALHTDCELIKRVVQGYDLFRIKGNEFYSESVISRLEFRNKKSEKASNSAKIRWNNANAMQSHSECNAKKDIKEKDIKENKRKVFITPLISDVQNYFTEKGINSNEYEKFFDYYESKGWVVGKVKMKDWKASVRNWIKNDFSKSKPSTQRNTIQEHINPKTY